MTRRCRLCSAATCCLVAGTLAIGSPARAQPPTYTVTDIGLVPGFEGTTAKAMNDAEQVLLYCWNEGNNALPFIWEDGELTALGSPGPEFTRVDAKDINEHRQIAGNAWGPTGFPAMAWLWEDDVFTDLGALGGAYAAAYGINNAGQITGWAYAPAPSTWFTFLYDGGTMTNLGELPAGVASDGDSINDLGQVTGYATVLGTTFYRGHIASTALGMFDLGTLGGPETHSSAINNLGQVVGNSSIGELDSDDFWVDHAFVWTDGVMVDLGTLPGDLESGAAAINDAGQIVGSSRGLTWESQRAVLWYEGGVYQLDTLIDPPGDWVFDWARDINNHGQIVTNGGLNGEMHPILLTPVE